MEALLGSKLLAPGIRFHPTDEELVMFYLKRKVLGKSLCPEMMAEVDVFQFAPWELPSKACLKTRDLNWFFLCPRSKKYPCGGRPNRAMVHGFWKATGIDRIVKYRSRPVGKIKTLIFHRGKAPKGDRTDWVMHEYRLEDGELMEQGVGQDSYVICKIYEKSGLGPKNGEHYGAPFVEEEWDSDNDDNLETDRGLVMNPEGCGIISNPVTVTGTVNALTGQPVTPGVAPSEHDSMTASTLAGQDAATPSLAQDPELSREVSLPPVETEEEELNRLLAGFADVDDNLGPEGDIFNGLEDLAGGDHPSEPEFDWLQFLSEECYLELEDLGDQIQTHAHDQKSDGSRSL